MLSTNTQETINQVKCALNRELSLYQYANFYRPPSPSVGVESLSKEIAIDGKERSHRMKICTWIFNVIDHCNFLRQTAVIAVDIFDRFMATRGNRCTPEFALLSATTAVFISAKVNEREGLQADSLAKLSRDQFRESDIKEMEEEILHGLNWLVHPPTACSFLCPLLQLLPSEVSMDYKNIIFENAQYITELAVFDSYFLNYPNSTIGFAALIICLDYEIMHDVIPLSSKEKFLKKMDEHFQLSQLTSLQKVQKRLHSVLLHRQHQMEDSTNCNHLKHLRHLSSPTKIVSVLSFS